MACMASLRSHNILGDGTVTEPNLNIRKYKQRGRERERGRKEGKRGETRKVAEGREERKDGREE